MREQLREGASLSMILVLCPFFVLLYWMMSSGGNTTYKVLLLDHDRGITLEDGTTVREAARFVEALTALRTKNGAPMVRIEKPADRVNAEAMLKNRAASACPG